MTTWRLYPATSGPASSSGDSTDYVMGVSFKVTSAGLSLAGYWWWVADASQNTNPTAFALWQSTGPGSGTLVSGSPVTSGTFSLGWNFTPLAIPVALTPATEYRAALGVGSGSLATGYSDTPAFWSTGPGASGISNGPLLAYSGIGGSSSNEPEGNGQMVFAASASDPTLSYPTSSFADTNYWLDVQVTDGGSGASATGVPAAITLAAPAGTVRASAGAAGAVAGLALTAIPGTVHAGAAVAGATARLALAAPAGTASAVTAARLTEQLLGGSAASRNLHGGTAASRDLYAGSVR